MKQTPWYLDSQRGPHGAARPSHSAGSAPALPVWGGDSTVGTQTSTPSSPGPRSVAPPPSDLLAPCGRRVAAHAYRPCPFHAFSPDAVQCRPRPAPSAPPPPPVFPSSSPRFSASLCCFKTPAGPLHGKPGAPRKQPVTDPCRNRFLSLSSGVK